VNEALRPLWPVTLILAGAIAAAWFGAPLPAELAGLRTYGPYAILGAAAGVSMWFNRERAFVLAVSLLAAFAAFDRFPGAFTFTACAIVVPLNALLALAVRERGARFGLAWRWVALLAGEAVLLYLLQRWVDLEGVFDHWLLHAGPTPLLGRLVFAAAFAAAVARAWPHHTPLELGIAGALVAFFIASTWAGDLRIYSLFMLTAGALLVAAVLQESHRMAFRDALTGLPNRRALEEQLRALAPPYAIAMVDVDHFKKFNDTYGHDIGDQVLRLVAARLAEASGGGRAYRYGGEEFTVLFRGQRLAQILPHLEAARASVQACKMTIRGQDRPKDKKDGAKRRADGKPRAATEDFSRTDMILSVTVSIGAAEPGKRLKSAAEVVKGADEALYRAKERGRNQVSR
jgi:diguanylate cyclase (GGDEF)-like protein